MKLCMKTFAMRKILLLAVAALSACAAGPDYQRPELNPPAAFKEVEGWKAAQPQANTERGEWWTLYGDSTLDSLMPQLNAANQDIRAAEARYRQARALVQSARAALVPSVSANASLTRSGSNVPTTKTPSGIATTRDATLDANWELDVWGRVRRGVESNTASAAASESDLASARLSAQAELVNNYFQLRVLDARQQLLDNTTDAYARSLQMTNNRYTAGIVSRADVVQAETQRRSAQTQALDNRRQRAQMEHAIAILLGKSPAEFALEKSPLANINGTLAEQPLPDIPTTLPSQLLERRPDIAAAEQRVIAANANVGVAQSAYFPTVALAASGGYLSSSASNWLTAPNQFWSLGPSLAATLFDGGARTAEKARSVAAYEETVANYRQTVLAAFQEVEDNLVALDLLQQQAQSQDAAVKAARQSVAILNNQYTVGKVAYLDVINVQTIAFSNEASALQILGQRYAASVQLIKALGGVW